LDTGCHTGLRDYERTHKALPEAHRESEQLHRLNAKSEKQKCFDGGMPPKKQG
jgi:hypothetical protein